MIGVVGMFLGRVNLKSSRRDIASLENQNGHSLEQYDQMRLLAFGHYRNDLFRMCKHTTITLIGVLACSFPSTTTQPVTPVGLVITFGLFIIAVFLVMASFLDRRQREAMEERFRNGH